MTTTQQTKAETAKRFVREVLGCNCSDEVFSRLEITPGNDAITSWPVDTQIDVGGRLLVLVLSQGKDSLKLRLGELVGEARRVRDQRSFNRVRLVVPSSNAGATEAELRGEFDATRGADEKVHLHVVPESELPHF